VKEGIFLVLVSRAPAPVWDIHPNRRITRKAPMPYVNHYSFHILDREWGHITFKISGHPPFPAQIILNGHEYVSRQARKAGILVLKEGNNFSAISDPAALAQVAETLTDESATGRLAAVCRRWIYICLDSALDAKERERSGFRYQYSVYQFEYCRNLLFQQVSAMTEVLEALVDRNRVRMNVDTRNGLLFVLGGDVMQLDSRSYTCVDTRLCGDSWGSAWTQWRASRDHWPHGDSSRDGCS
jgi:hypothetical protein